MASVLFTSDPFLSRHLGPGQKEIGEILEFLNIASLDALIDSAIPSTIRWDRSLRLPSGKGEVEALLELRKLMTQNQVFRSYIGMGYHDCIMPPVIQRNILENPGWYTAYTPYQAEIAQGRLEALFNFHGSLQCCPAHAGAEAGGASSPGLVSLSAGAEAGVEAGLAR